MARLLAASGVSVEHTPWDVRDGGAAETAYGLACFESFTHRARGDALDADLVLFNFG